MPYSSQHKREAWARAAYRTVLDVVVSYFETSLGRKGGLSVRQRALSAICVGAMVLARTIDDAALAREICEAGADFACGDLGDEA